MRISSFHAGVLESTYGHIRLIAVYYLKFSVVINQISRAVYRLSPTYSWTGDPQSFDAIVLLI